MFDKTLINIDLSEQSEIAVRDSWMKNVRENILLHNLGYEVLSQGHNDWGLVLDSSIRMQGEFANTLVVEMGTDMVSRVREVGD